MSHPVEQHLDRLSVGEGLRLLTDAYVAGAKNEQARAARKESARHFLIDLAVAARARKPEGPSPQDIVEDHRHIIEEGAIRLAEDLETRRPWQERTVEAMRALPHYLMTDVEAPEPEDLERRMVEDAEMGGRAAVAGALLEMGIRPESGERTELLEGLALLVDRGYRDALWQLGETYVLPNGSDRREAERERNAAVLRILNDPEHEHHEQLLAAISEILPGAKVGAQ